jgi:hypothetical protein
MAGEVVEVMAKAGFDVGFGYSQSAGSSTEFAGTIGYLPPTYYNNSSYDYNSELFVYPYADPTYGRTYWVVDYGVDKP